jgi:hypothetical protein
MPEKCQIFRNPDLTEESPFSRARANLGALHAPQSAAELHSGSQQGRAFRAAAGEKK